MNTCRKEEGRSRKKEKASTYILFKYFTKSQTYAPKEKERMKKKVIVLRVYVCM